ncbi:MAG: glycosyltransferase family 39 protein [Candidatus Levybacteria bacterium]|nr:glycosyltransferase family 39 protein [Candidatus Levybacteria bacterium]
MKGKFLFKKAFILACFILVLGFVLRAQEAISQNFLFLMDQGRDMMAVKSIVFDLHPTLIGPYTSLRGVFQGPLWYYLLSIPTIIFNGNPWGTILLMLSISIGALVVTYLWTKRLFGEKTAIITSFLLAVSPEAVAAATYSWNPHPMWLLVVLYAFSFYELIGLKNNRFHLIVWPVIALMFHFQTALAVLILAASFIFLLAFNRKIFFQKLFFYGLAISFIFFIPQILFELRHDFLMTKSVLNTLSGQDQGLFVGGENRNYLSLVKGNISLFYYNFSTSFVRDGYLKSLPKLALIIIIGFLVLHKKLHFFDKKEWSFISVIGGLVGIVSILSSLYPFPLRYWFLTGFQAIYILIFGLILSKIFKWKIGKITVLMLMAFLLFYSGEKLYTLYVNPPNDGGLAKTNGKLKAIDYIYQDSKGKPFGLLVFTPPVYTYAYDYLVWWYGSRKYNYIPHRDKKGIFYLLIEPDPSKPWSYRGWLETVVKAGEPEVEISLPSGLIIQKYIEKNHEI